MKDLLFKTSVSKIYMIMMIIITLLVIGGYYSFAIFTVTKEKSNAISIVTGNLSYKLEVDGKEGNTLTVEANTVKEFVINLSNPNNRKARFNFYYVGNLPSNVITGYKVEEDTNSPPSSTGINLEKIDTTSSSNIYKIMVANASSNEITITLGVEVGLDYNNLSLPNDGHLFEEYQGFLASKVTNYYGSGDTYNDGTDTFITGKEPNNYIWYSGKLWRAVSVNNNEQTTKLVTQWNISSIPFGSGSNPSFDGSFMEEWLNDMSVDGFLSNLRESDKFIKTNSRWNATMMSDTTKPPETTMVEDAIGLLNIYEYNIVGAKDSYLNNNLWWWTINRYNSVDGYFISSDGYINSSGIGAAGGIRPAINLKNDVKIISGCGTENNPFRLLGDDDINLSGTYLKDRFSGEYIRFGTDENNLYRIVSHETKGLTKITSAIPLKNNGTFRTIYFGNNTNFSITNTIGTFLNSEYLANYVGNNYSNMIEDNTVWYLGTVYSDVSYKLAKYIDVSMSGYATNTNAKIGLLRMGELMAGQFDRYMNNCYYWTLTPLNLESIRIINNDRGLASGNVSNSIYGIKPALNLKSNVIITGGDGTKEKPFEIALQE